MNIPINYQVIKKDGEPLFVVVPYNDFVQLIDKEPTIPHEVVEKTIIENKTLVRAWREYLNITQTELAEKMNVSQAAIAQMESEGARPRKSTLQKLAMAMGIDVLQLT